MEIISVKYVRDAFTGEDTSISIFYPDKTISFLIDPNNRHYQEIMDLVEAGELTIEPADEPAAPE